MNLARLQSAPEMAARDGHDEQFSPSHDDLARGVTSAAHNDPPRDSESSDDFQQQLTALIQAIDATAQQRELEAAAGSEPRSEATHAPQAQPEPTWEPEPEAQSANGTESEQVSGYEARDYEAAPEADSYATHYDLPEDGIDHGSLPNVLVQAQAEQSAASKSVEDDDEEFDKAAFPFIDPQQLLSGRFIGFMAGLGTSVAVGGMVLLGGSFTEPSAIASYVSSADNFPTITAPNESPAHVPAKLQSRLADAVEEAAPRPEAQSAATANEATRNFPAESTSDIRVTFAGVGDSPKDLPAAAPPEQDATSPAELESQAVEGPTAQPSTETTALAEQDPVQTTANGQPQTPAQPPAPAEVQLQFDTVVEPSQSGEPSREARVKRDVNMRAGPNTAEPVVKVVSAGSPIEIISCSGWCEVVYAGQRGWIYKDFLEVSSLEEDQSTATTFNRL